MRFSPPAWVRRVLRARRARNAEYAAAAMASHPATPSLLMPYTRRNRGRHAAGRRQHG